MTTGRQTPALDTPAIGTRPSKGSRATGGAGALHERDGFLVEPLQLLCPAREAAAAGRRPELAGSRAGRRRGLPVLSASDRHAGLRLVAGPAAGSGTGPTPREVAQIAIDQMNLSAIDIGIAPEPGPDSVGLVGMPVWMWAANPNSHTYGPATASASAGGITVTATARVDQITWVMGDGSKVVCHTAGTPYQASYGKKASPDCGHVYTKSSAGQPGDQFTVTAISDWVVTWAGAGQTERSG